MRIGVKNMYDLIKLRVSIEDYVYYGDFKEKSLDEIRDIAQTTNSPIHLAYLSTYDDTLIKRSVAINKNVPIHVLVNLSNDPNQYVRLSVAKNVKTPKDILKKLMNDSSPHVGRTAAETFMKVGGVSNLGSSIRGLIGPVK